MDLRAVWFNGGLVDPSRPHLNVNDHGVVVGDGAFETLLPVPGPDAAGGEARQAFAVRRHLERLRRSSAVLGIALPYSDDDLRGAIGLCLAEAPESGLVRITVTSGTGPLGSQRGGQPASVVVAVGGDTPSYESGTAVSVMSFPRNERGALAGVKSTSYAENVIALRIASQRGATEALFGDTRGRLSEGTGSNIFWVDGATLCTPPLDTGCLAGVTRGLVMERLEVVERHLPVTALPGVSEAFLTSTTRLVQSIGSVDGTALPVVDGPLTKKALAAMADLVAAEIDP